MNVGEKAMSVQPSDRRKLVIAYRVLCIPYSVFGTVKSEVYQVVSCKLQVTSIYVLCVIAFTRLR